MTAPIPFRSASFRVPKLPARQRDSREAWTRRIAEHCAKYRGTRRMVGPVRLELTYGVLRPKNHYGAHGVFPKSPAYPSEGHSALDLMQDAIVGIVRGGLIASHTSIADLQITRIYVDTAARTGLHVKVTALPTRVGSSAEAA